MTICGMCGKELGPADAVYLEGTAYCHGCETVVSQNIKPCANCGIYLPIVEMKMHASRYYCNYCIMDVMDDEHRIQRIAEEETRRVKQQKSSHEEHHDYPDYGRPSDYYSSYSNRDNEDNSRPGKNGTQGKQDHLLQLCELCGIATEFRYEIFGKKLCKTCSERSSQDPESKKPGAMGLLGAIFATVQRVVSGKKRIERKLVPKKNKQN